MSEKSKRSFSIISSVPQALGFNDADLKANRAGVLSERQRHHFARQRSLAKLAAMIFGVMFVLLCLAGAAALATRTSPRTPAGWLLTGGILSGVLTGISIYTGWKMQQDAANEIVYSTSGVVRRRKDVVKGRHGESNSETYYIYTDDLPFRFRVDDDIYDAFANPGLRSSY